ncbi:hypothetical protein DIE14_36190 [Burkholderia sp. Bp9017]|uniref:Uncharacterized protein n=1 Tax=Burkholderia anthina TaxID=179879 RepID=A0A7T6VIV9_9BURK|nr:MULTISPECIES: hypothetical protein [Burkholderia]MBY4870589.1 hypothetical protein [Burkholderia anthina]QQK04708.1 hypothetical protein JFN94_25605 [Burkholderia anthina]RQZ11819.1 hypothetical protein DIE14_36190 [Burkholderia sp. Bp9017]RQZ30398.1 hypothetical protein DIE13_25270 [Burkholderia sp. Bp9016]
MTEPHTIALIVDPECGERIREVAAGARHTWVVTSDANDVVVERIWRESRIACTSGAEGGVTRFDRHGDDPESWCDSILDAIEDHHGNLALQHGYTALDVHGVALSARLRSALVECGFSVFTPTNEGFVAGK